MKRKKEAEDAQSPQMMMETAESVPSLRKGKEKKKTGNAETLQMRTTTVNVQRTKKTKDGQTQPMMRKTTEEDENASKKDNGKEEDPMTGKKNLKDVQNLQTTAESVPNLRKGQEQKKVKNAQILQTRKTTGEDKNASKKDNGKEEDPLKGK